ncbi:MAG: hypothetical protein A2W04_10405 [Betaproteobacteria bacterium RBG_16_64_9]|nr:MAG: hypothetical protein A2W04_10405 [Betaproteobacteria bacterium RBG_16_64_9]OGA26504.1 MAG: hypothetical protein A3I01_09945 [Betaproteobacteria bacterium RIFCSPLOWO2_02_FULL_65_24]OGA36662.1 MAG: hypothetical protein A3G80_11395 [Betaproteobacteria bacterium RIFCSPLOWO2_12_FULL_62_13b]
MKSLWGAMGVPMAGMMMPTLDVSEIDKRITDMRAVENWLNMNLSLLRMAIQGLEMQKAALDAMKGAEQAMGEQATHPAMEAWLNALQGKSSPPDPSKEK